MSAEQVILVLLRCDRVLYTPMRHASVITAVFGDKQEGHQSSWFEQDHKVQGRVKTVCKVVVPVNVDKLHDKRRSNCFYFFYFSKHLVLLMHY